MNKKAETADDLRRRMDAVRGHLNKDVEQVASSVRVKTDWRYYVRRHPVAVIAAATAVGYAVVPRRIEKVTPDPETLRKMAKQEDLVVAPRSKASHKDGIASKLLALAFTAAARSAMGFVSGTLGEKAGEKAAENTGPGAASHAGSTADQFSSARPR